MKEKKFRRRAEGEDDADAEDGSKVVVKAARDKGKEKPLSKASGPVLLSFAEDDEDAGSRELKTSSTTSKSSLRKDRARGKLGAKAGDVSLLSFDDGISNGATTTVLKSKKKTVFGADKGGGHRLGIGRDVSASNSAILSSNLQPQTGEYTKEKLAELQWNTIRLGVPAPAVDSKPAETVVVLKGLVKPAAVTNGSTLDGTDKVEDLGGGVGSGIGLGVGVGTGVGAERSNVLGVRVVIDRGREEYEIERLKGDDAESRLGLMGIGVGAESGGITHIPDAAAIAAAKAKRERLRQAQAAPDYIALAPGDGADLRSKLRESALVRDQDDDIEREDDESSADEGEVQGRLAFLGEKTTTGQKSRAGVFESVEQRAAVERPLQERRDDDEEDEERRWEEEQLRKGFGKRVDEAAGRATATSSKPSSAQVQSSGLNASLVHQHAPTAGAGWGFGRSSERVTIQQQADSAMRSLQEGLQRMRETNSRTEGELHRTKESLALSLQSITSLEETLATAGEKYLYMQELRDHISILCDFLQDKAPLIEMLEEHMQVLHEQRANALTERRAADNAEEMEEAKVQIGAAVEVFSRGGGTASAASAASAAGAAFSAREGSSLAPELDEFGRDVNLQRRMEAKRRAQARERRAAKAAHRSMPSLATFGNGDEIGSRRVEGESSSEESDGEASGYQSQHENVIDTAGRTFGDATEEFAHLHKVKERLEGWKLQYPSAYRDAYVSLSVASIFAPYVRLELLRWDPLRSDTGFTNMHWYQELFAYGMPQNGKPAEANDSDSELVPRLIEKVALPVLHHEIQHCWDTLSSQGTRRAVVAVEDITAHLSTSSEHLQDLLSAVHVRMADAVSELDVPAWSYQLMNAVPQAARLAAYRFGRSLRLLRNIGLWKNVLAMPVLEKLALDELLSGKILPHLRTLLTTLHDAVTRTERVMNVLAELWLGYNHESRPKLASFVEFVMALTRAVEKRRDGDDGVELARRLKKILVALNEYDRARQLFKHFQMKEAL